MDNKIVITGMFRKDWAFLFGTRIHAKKSQERLLSEFLADKQIVRITIEKLD